MSDSLRPHGLQHSRPLSLTIFWNLSKFMSIASVMPSSDALFSFCPQSLPASGIFPTSQLFSSGGQNNGTSALASVLPMSIQGWSPCFPGDYQESSPAPQFEGINSSMLCLLYGPALTTVCDHWEDHSLDYKDICLQSNVSAFQHTMFVIAFCQEAIVFWFHGCSHPPQWF